ncbi:hypothetical protein WN50_32580 [Limnoraphis robusta CS-951]|uniref:Uncharacterized protein n=1 Tax=Limnoraphis robusta CS-951 TaxID=1637645 RepID=A0A0J9EXE2_9CYAN|nr:hypothetical protein WN50_32580 [Limnoraphis robusta CS-951]
MNLSGKKYLKLSLQNLPNPIIEANQMNFGDRLEKINLSFFPECLTEASKELKGLNYQKLL